MSEGIEPATSASPVPGLVGLLAGAWVAQAIFVAAKLNIADLLQDGPKSACALATATRTHAPSLYRVMRALASVGVFAEGESGRFRLTPMAESLRSDVPDSLRAYAAMLGEEWVWRSWGDILYSVRTGRPAFDHVYGAPAFEYYAANPAAARSSADGLSSRSAAENTAIVRTYDFSAARLVVDVGGGQGALLASVLGANPGLQGILLDKPHMVAMARRRFERTALSRRCDLVAGDFFTSIPVGADIYLMKKVIHDWDDAQARAILEKCRMAIPGTGRLLIVDHVVPGGNAPSYAKLLDLLMLVLPGGRERTAGEHRDLLASAGFKLARIVPVLSSLCIVEAVPS